MKYIDCAISIENKFYSHLNGKVYWYLISDNLYFKTHVKSLYPDKVIINPGIDICHTFYEINSCPDSSMHGIVEEELLFSYCNKFVITYGSGVGRNAVAIGFNKLNSSSTYAFKHFNPMDLYSPDNLDKCELLTLEDLIESGTGL